MEVQGRIYKVLPTRTGTKKDGSEWRIQEFILEFFETPDQRWSDKVVLSVRNDRIKEYDLHEGDEVKVGFSHNVNLWNGRWYPEFSIYKFEKVKGVEVVAAPSQQTEQQSQPAAEPTKAAPASDGNANTDEDDLPF